MKKIPSFEKNHDILQPGLHICGTAHGVTTFDLRFKKPNAGDYLSTASAHTIEHLLATILRNGEKKDDIIYFGPMGCRTGFYLLTVNLNFGEVKNLLISAFEKVPEIDEIPGSKREECGNFADHDLDGAKRECEQYLRILQAL